MNTVKSIFLGLETIFFILTILLALIYSLTIALLPRFHHRNDILTLNICVATIFCCTAWLPNAEIFTASRIVPRWKQFDISLQVLQTFFTIQVPLSFVLASIHRHCSIVYRKNNFFKTKRWIFVFIASQWVLGAAISVPDLISVLLDYRALWMEIHVFVSVVVIPAIVFLVTNMMTFCYVRSSSRRIQPQHPLGRRRSKRITSRDLHLLRHMVLMFCIFVGGWAPVFILPIVEYCTEVSPVLPLIFSLWCELALLLDVIDLYLYNHQMRRFLQDLCCRC